MTYLSNNMSAVKMTGLSKYRGEVRRVEAATAHLHVIVSSNEFLLCCKLSLLNSADIALPPLPLVNSPVLSRYNLM